MSEKETQNLYANDDSGLTLGQIRLKPYVVVSDWWYESILHLLSYCVMQARVWDFEKVPKSKEHPLGLKSIPPDFRMMAYLIDNDLLNSPYAYSQHDVPIKFKTWWRFKWWFKRLWRAIWMRERYKLDRYWMSQFKNPEIND